MLHWSLVFLVIAIIAAILGFGGIAGAAVGVAKILFFVFVIICLCSIIGVTLIIQGFIKARASGSWVLIRLPSASLSSLSASSKRPSNV